MPVILGWSPRAAWVSALGWVCAEGGISEEEEVVVVVVVSSFLVVWEWGWRTFLMVSMMKMIICDR